jgi:hypothetical protein
VAAVEVHGGARWWRWFQAALLSVVVDGFFPLCLPLFSLCFFFFFSFSCSSFLSSSSGLIFFLSFGLFTLSSTLLCSPPSVFIGKTEGRERQGQPMCSRPGGCILSVFLYPVEGHRSNLGKWGISCRRLFGGFGERGNGQSKGEKSSSSPASRVQGKKKGYIAVQNGTVLGFSSFFNEQCMKRCRFGQNTSFYLKGKGDKKNMSEFTLVFNL